MDSFHTVYISHSVCINFLWTPDDKGLYEDVRRESRKQKKASYNNYVMYVK